jgi:hypothetical protein
MENDKVLQFSFRCHFVDGAGHRLFIHKVFHLASIYRCVFFVRFAAMIGAKVFLEYALRWNTVYFSKILDLF